MAEAAGGAAVRATYAAGAEIVRQGGTSEEFYVLLRGAVEVVRDGRPIMVFSRPGAFLGELAAILKIPRTATLRAVEETEVLVFPRPIDRTLRHEPKALKRLVATIEARVRHLEDLLAEYERPVFLRIVDRLAYLSMTHGGQTFAAGRSKADRAALRAQAETALERNDGIPDPVLLDPFARAAGVGAEFRAALAAEFGGFRPFGRRPSVASLNPLGDPTVEEMLRDVHDLALRVVEGNERLSRYASDPTNERNREAAATDLEARFDPPTLRSILMGVFLRYGLKGIAFADARGVRLRFENDLDRAEEEAARRRDDRRVQTSSALPSPFRLLADRHGLEARYLEALRAASG